LIQKNGEWVRVGDMIMNQKGGGWKMSHYLYDLRLASYMEWSI
jgi:hypothetical protein